MLFTKKEFFIAVIAMLLSLCASQSYYTSTILEQSYKIELLTQQLADKDYNYANNVNDYSPENNTLDSVTNLKQQVEQLTKQLIEKDQQVNQFIKVAVTGNTPKKSKREQWFQSPEYIKTAMIPASVLPVIDELSKRLVLSPQKSEELTALLQAKAEADHDSMKPYLDEVNKNSQIDFDPEQLQRLNELANEQLEANQMLYNEQLASLLNTDQLADYQQLENEKTQKNTNLMVNHQTAELSMAVPTLDDAQKQQIKMLYQQTYSNEQDTPLGVSGSIYAKRVNAITEEDRQNHQIAIEQLLTSEQHESYKAYQESLFERVN